MKPTHKPRNLINQPLLAMAMLFVIAASSQSALATGDDGTTFKRVSTQYIAALGDPGATSGDGAESWGIWRVDPGPRGVKIKNYDKLQAAGGVAPANWKFDSTDWWLEENGLIMEAPEFPLSPGKYLVTGGREARAVLTIHPSDESGNRRWELSHEANLYDVTHLGCRSARYTPAGGTTACSPANTPTSVFRVTPGEAMPAVEGCNKLDYTVLIVFGVAVDS